MEIPEAIKLIQEMKSWMPSDNKNFDKEREAIDTVVAYCKKPLPTNEDVETWNAAIDAAAENAEAYRGLVDKQSILKLKK